MNFDHLPLHDAPVESITYLWEQHILRIELSAFMKPGEDAIPYILQFSGVREFKIPHEEPWGPSVYINRIESENGEYNIEMQSGDVISIKSEGYEFSQIPL